MNPLASKPLASLSLDLDNKWSYLKTHGDPDWQAFPSYLDTVCPRIVDFLSRHDQRITFFVVGQDAERDENREALRLLSEHGHEMANHSFGHEPWLHLYSEKQTREELFRAEQAIYEATGQRTVGFRGPGFSISPTVVKVLEEMQYAYDASTFPTFLGPVARAYYFMTAKNLTHKEVQQRKKLFGNFWEGFRTLRPHRLSGRDTRLVEIPVTTMPLLKVPIHLSYVLYLAQYSRKIAWAYFRTALRLCRIHQVQPSLLMHPLDFMGRQDDESLRFFPAMAMDREKKVAFTEAILESYLRDFRVVTMLEHAQDYGCRDVESRNVAAEAEEPAMVEVS